MQFWVAYKGRAKWDGPEKEIEKKEDSGSQMMKIL